jgi:hypothetical protein
MSKQQFIFEPGSYGGTGCYMPSIACLKGSAETELKYHFVLVNYDIDFKNEDDAVTYAKNDLDQADKKKQLTGSDSSFAESLKSRGYRSVDGFKIVK